MIELNFMVLEDMLCDARVSALVESMAETINAYIIADNRYQKATSLNGYGSDWQRAVLENPDVLREILGKRIDAAFTTLTILRKEYKKLTGARLFDGGIGVPKNECTEAEWISFRAEKADVLDQVVSYLSVRSYELRQAQ